MKRGIIAKTVKIGVFRPTFTVMSLEVCIQKHIMSRLLYFWVDLVPTCVDLRIMILY